jgi:hypothetical protein
MTVKQVFNTSADLDFPNVLPTLDLDFANSKTLDPRITFTRSSGGSYVGADGFIKYAGVNEPRFDHDPATGESLGLLIEESRTNFIINSENVPLWVIFNMVPTGNAITLPDGSISNNVEYRGETTDPNSKLLRSTPSGASLVAGESWCFSVFLRAGTEDTVNVNLTNNTGTEGIRVNSFNMITGIASGLVASGGATNPLVGSIKYPNGWWRVWISGTFANTAPGFQTLIRLLGFSNQVSLTTSFSAWGAQLERGSFPTSYIPTQGSTRTRSGDNVSMTGTNFLNTFSRGSLSELSVFYSGIAPYAATNGAFYWELKNSASTERIYFRYAGLPQLIVALNGATVLGTFANEANIADIKTVGSVSPRNVSIRLNRGSPTYEFTNNYTALSRMPIGLEQLSIGSFIGGAAYLNGTIRKLSFYLKRLTPSQSLSLIQL